MFGRLFRTPETVLIGTFALLILIGTALLRLPASQPRDVEPVSFVDAAFTATSAVCVTGLITRDTAVDFSRTGQTVVLVLIQLGGLGVMTFAALAFSLLGMRMSFGSHAVLQSMFFHDEARGRLRAAVMRIVLMTLTFEAVGAVLLLAGVSREQAGGWFEAVFLSVSAFCNAGFSVYSDSIESLRDQPLVVWTIMGLIIAGGLGYMVLFEAARRTWRALLRRPQSPVNWSLHSHLVILTSGVLILAGAIGLALVGLTPSEDAIGGRLLHSLFQSVTARTAGFNTVEIAALSTPALMILIPLMFIGGSPGSCAGGIKTTSLVIWFTRVTERLAGRSEIVVGRRRVPNDVVRRAGLVIALAALWNGVGVFVLGLTEHVGASVRLEDVMFEQVSAFATVGLSTGLTAQLSTVGKIWIIASMFVGRLGPLTIALAVFRREGRARFHYPAEPVMIG